MPSPFPGMDPFLETKWANVHTRLIARIADAMNERLPTDLVALVEERIAIVSEDEDPEAHRHVRGDVVVRGPDEAFATHSAVEPDGSALGTLRIVTRTDPSIERSIRVVTAKGDRSIVVIELISPSNKSGEGLKDYRSKRAAILAEGTHVVEIDLTRRGNWRALLNPHILPAHAVTDYRYTTYHADDPAAVHVTPIALRNPLPPVAIPLRSGEPIMSLPLAPLLAEVYRASRAETWIDYAAPLLPPLSQVDEVWAASLIPH